MTPHPFPRLRPTFRGRSLALLIVAFACGSVTATAAEPALAAPEQLRGVAMLEDQRLELDLRRVQVFAEDFQLVVETPLGPRREPTPAVSFYSGVLVDDPAAEVFLAVDVEGPLQGWIRRRDQVLMLRREGGTLKAEAADMAAIEQRLQQHTCAADLPTVPEAATRSTTGSTTAPRPAATDASRGASYAVRLAIDTDFEFFQQFGSSSAATIYVGGLVGATSALFEGELDAPVVLSHLRLRSTASDPYAETNPQCQLYEFGREWNNNQGGINRSIAHFLSGKGGGLSGIAWVGVLCTGAFNTQAPGGCSTLSGNGSFGGAYGITQGIDGNFDPGNPSTIAELYVFAHEIGHNFDSPHTHCYSPPVDQCFSGETFEGACFSGTPTLPGPQGAGSGTLMSYCHLRPGGLSNITMTLGAGHPYGNNPGRVPNRMAAHLAARASASPSCLAPVPGSADAIFGNGFE